MRYYEPMEQHFSDLLDLILDSPHALIAGTTGSGKSVLMNAILYNFMINKGVANRLFLIDPKRVELSIYKNLPHVIEYTSDSKRAVCLLRWACQLMDERYQEMEKQNRRQYDGGHIYIFIDEIADLMLSDERKQIERYLQRLTAVGRASNIHVIIATQLIRADILTTKITGNIPLKIALRCVNSLESRQIVGVKGAENLPHHGQGLLLSPKFTQVMRVDIPYVEECNILETVDMWRYNMIVK